MSTQFFILGTPQAPFILQSGMGLSHAQLAYETYGTLNEKKDNAILLFHALTGSHHAAGFAENLPPQAGESAQSFWTEECRVGWWDDFIGSGKAIDTDQFFVICANYLGGCYGSTGPSSINPETGKSYGSLFPKITVADIADSQMKLLDYFGIQKLHAVVGASLGGMLSLSVATRYPERVSTVIPIATCWRVPPLQRLLNFEQIFAIESDPSFNRGDYSREEGAQRGLAAARMISHKTFVSLDSLAERAREEIVFKEDDLSWYNLTHPLESYLLHQGRKFIRRFDANTYLHLLHAWQSFDLVKEAFAEDEIELFKRCRDQKFLVITIDSDVCFYPDEQEEIVAVLKSVDVDVEYAAVHSDKGHDSFLLEPELYEPLFRTRLSGL